MKHLICEHKNFNNPEEIASIINECLWRYRYDFTLIDVAVNGNTLYLKFYRVNEPRKKQ